MTWMSELAPTGILVVVWLGVLVYLLVLASRLVRAIERIADTFGAH